MAGLSCPIVVASTATLTLAHAAISFLPLLCFDFDFDLMHHDGMDGARLGGVAAADVVAIMIVTLGVELVSIIQHESDSSSADGEGDGE